MRKEFGKIMEELMENDKNVHFIVLDGAYEIYEKLSRKFPDNCWNFGLTEQAAIGIASGMALDGLKPYVYSITPFLIERPFEQVKLDIVEQRANVKLVSYWNYPGTGPTHTTKDAGGICKILGLRYFEPNNSHETRETLLRTYHDNLPAFFYLTKDEILNGD
jgi:transketolase